MATKKRTRAFYLVIVVFFIMTSFGLSLILIYQESHNNTGSTQTNVVGTQLPGFSPVASVSTLGIKDQQVGKGAVVKQNQTVDVYYTGAVASTGTIFSSTASTGQAASINLNETILGWKLGIPGMKVGGTRRLLIPAAMAYGANPPSGSGIPANAPLVFDVTVLGVSK